MKRNWAIVLFYFCAIMCLTVITAATLVAYLIIHYYDKINSFLMK